jgi:hypothetical protein
MSTAALAFPATPITWSGVSAEAQSVDEVRGRLSRERGNSLTLEAKRLSMFNALLDACVAAPKIYEGIRLHPATYEHALAFLLALPITYRAPQISVHPDGEIEFEWFRGPRAVVTIAFGESGDVQYAGLIGQRTIHGEEPFAGAIPQPIADILADPSIRTE